MLGSSVLEVAIGIIFVFLLISLICTQIGNKISDWARWRAKDLEDGIRDLILKGDTKLLERLYTHPVIQSLVPKDSVVTNAIEKTPLRRFVHQGSKPYGIPPRTFVLALFDATVPGASDQTTVKDLRKKIESLSPDSPLRKPLLTLVTGAETDIDKARTNVENWFNSAMDQVTLVYKREMWRLAIGIGIVVSIVLNVDSIAITTALWRDSAVRATVVAAATRAAENDPDPNQALKQLNSLSLPIGWSVNRVPDLPWFTAMPKDWESPTFGPSYARSLILKLLGWLITGLAGAQGAPFWFDLLKKLTQRS